MSEKLEALRASLAKDEARIQKLQEEIKKKKERIKEMESAEIMNTLNSLSAKGFEIKKIISAIRSKDYATLKLLLEDENQDSSMDKSETGTGSAFEITKEE